MYPNGGATRYDLGRRPGLCEVRGFDPRSGGPLREGPVRRVRGPGLAWTGDPPSHPHRDWLALLRRVEGTAPAMEFPAEEWRRAAPLDLGIDPVGLRIGTSFSIEDAIDEGGLGRVGFVVPLSLQSGNPEVYKGTPCLPE